MTLRHPFKRTAARIAAAATLTALTGFSGQALAQGYPNKPLKFVVPFSAGSATDAVGRIVLLAVNDAAREFLGGSLVGELGDPEKSGVTTGVYKSLCAIGAELPGERCPEGGISRHVDGGRFAEEAGEKVSRRQFAEDGRLGPVEAGRRRERRENEALAARQ